MSCIFEDKYTYNMLTLHEILTQKEVTLSVAESCSGGNIAHTITQESGSSVYFYGGVVAYQNKVKEHVLNVNSIDIEQFGAVSEPVAEQMANGVRMLLKTDYAVSTTGIAGPNGGSLEKPVGTVWIGVSSKNNTFAKKFIFSGSRIEVIEKSTKKALQMLENVVLMGS